MNGHINRVPRPLATDVRVAFVNGQEKINLGNCVSHPSSLRSWGRDTSVWRGERLRKRDFLMQLLLTKREGRGLIFACDLCSSCLVLFLAGSLQSLFAFNFGENSNSLFFWVVSSILFAFLCDNFCQPRVGKKGQNSS